MRERPSSWLVGKVKIGENAFDRPLGEPYMFSNEGVLGSDYGSTSRRFIPQLLNEIKSTWNGNIGRKRNL